MLLPWTTLCRPVQDSVSVLSIVPYDSFVVNPVRQVAIRTTAVTFVTLVIEFVYFLYILWAFCNLFKWCDFRVLPQRVLGNASNILSCEVLWTQRKYQAKWKAEQSTIQSYLWSECHNLVIIICHNYMSQKNRFYAYLCDNSAIVFNGFMQWSIECLFLVAWWSTQWLKRLEIVGERHRSEHQKVGQAHCLRTLMMEIIKLYAIGNCWSTSSLGKSKSFAVAIACFCKACWA